MPPPAATANGRAFDTAMSAPEIGEATRLTAPSRPWLADTACGSWALVTTDFNAASEAVPKSPLTTPSPIPTT